LRRCATIGADRVLREDSEAAASGDGIMGQDSVTAAIIELSEQAEPVDDRKVGLTR